jgi:hypothetical protein
MPTFSTLFTPPAAPAAFDLEAEVETSRVALSWTATALGVDFAYYTISRAVENGPFVVLATITTESTTTFDDFEAPLNHSLQYRLTVTNAIELTSLPAEGAATLESLGWWLVTASDPDQTFELAVVVGYRDEQPLEEERFVALGRSKKLVVMGELLGIEGGIDVDLSREQADVVQMIRMASMHSGEFVLIKSPFGEVFRSHIGTVERRRTVAGRQRVSFDFVEVA